MAKKRSPAHPAYTLSACIEWAEELYKKEGEHFIHMEAVAAVWKVSTGASGFLQRISSLKQFGLLEEKGAKDDREFKLADLALDLILHERDSREWSRAVVRAAVCPPIHRELWDLYQGKLPPEDASLRTYLLRTREGATFNINQVDSFLDRFRDTVSFAKLDEPDTEEDKTSDENSAGHLGGSSEDSGVPKADPLDLQVGSLVQWTSNGKWMFPQPLPITRIDEKDGEHFAFFEGKGHAPMSQLSVANGLESPSPPISLIASSSEPERQSSEDEVSERTTLDEGVAVLTMPKTLSEDSVEDFEHWIKGQVRKVRRRAGLPANPTDD